MKKVTILSTLFLFVLGLSMGVTISQVEAEKICAQCFYDDDIYCSMVPDNRCTGIYPYGYFEFGSCAPGGNFNGSCLIFRGCCLDDDHFMRIYDPLP